MFYAMHEMSAKLTPSSLKNMSTLKLLSNGIEEVETDNRKVICYQTLTKMKFIFVVDSKFNSGDSFEMFRKIYNLYSEYVSTNPFYELEMPIRIDVFDNEVKKLIMSV
jgi:hypothetical protein